MHSLRHSFFILLSKIFDFVSPSCTKWVSPSAYWQLLLWSHLLWLARVQAHLLLNLSAVSLTVTTGMFYYLRAPIHMHLECFNNCIYRHCDGPASTAVSSVTSTAAESVSTTATASIAPSPTESIGCEPHGDHWHCDGPASTDGSSVSSTTAESEATTETASIAPSPLESIGCEPHGDHWHCDGPAETSSAASTSASATAEDQDNGVGAQGVHILLLAGLSAAAAGLNF